MPLAKAASSRVVAVVSSVILLLSGRTRRPPKPRLFARCPPTIGRRGDFCTDDKVADLCGYEPFYRGRSDRLQVRLVGSLHPGALVLVELADPGAAPEPPVE